ncbi:MAG: DUF2946 family protein [Betaproteobacteria bacterium]|nr:DUF2946 family protein [Betaproteobacteria bacterium]
MDDIVRQAMAKWPNVPDCYGWLGLDSRGQWHMRDDRVQALGGFQSGVAAAKGSVLRHEKLIEFIGRNYEADASGRWYFQNGPQRVYVELEATPWIWRVQADGGVVAHTGGEPTEVIAGLVDEHGHVYAHTARGLGLVHSLDVVQAAEHIEQGRWSLQACRQAELPARFGYVRSPQQA